MSINLNAWSERALRSGVAGMICLLAVPTFAQTGQPTSIPESPASGDAPGAPVANGATTTSVESGGLQEIVVTAQRRAETLQKSSVAIQVLGQDELVRAGVAQVKDLSALVPGLQIAFGGNETQTFIRGIGDFSSTGLGQSAVAVNANGVYVADEASVGPLFYDIARIEVLKGPQGTLYGRNATAGAVNIVANQPTDELGGSVTAETGNYGLQKYVGVFNLPISATLWTRAAVQYVSRNGYLSDGTDDDLQKSARLQMLWKPTGEFSARVTADYEEAGGYGAGAVLLPRQSGTGAFTGSINATNNAALLAAADVPPFLVVTPGAGPNPTPKNSTGLNRDSQRDNTQRNVGGEFNYDLGFADLTFLPALRTANNTYFGYTPGFPYGDLETVRQQSYELRLAKATDFIKAVAGLYFFDDQQTINQSAAISVFVPSLHTMLDTDLGTKSYAGFGQATIGLTDAARLIGGLRYTHEVKTLDGSRTQIPLGSASIVTSLDSRASFNSVNFRAGFEYDLTERNMLYGTVSTGFKAGGFNTFQSENGISDVYQPEKLTDYELGARNRFLDNRLQFNVEAFYWQDKNSQQSHLTYDPTGSLQFETLNAASASIYGVDFDIVAQPWDADSITMVLEYLHGEFKDFVYDIPTANYAPASIGCAAGPSAGHSGFTTLDCSGKPLPRAPSWAGTASYQHAFAVNNGATLVADVDLNFSGKRYLAVDYIDSELAPSYIRENVTLTYNAPGKRWSLAVFGRNLSNRAVYLGGVQAALSPGIFYSTVDAPRTYGVRLNVNFR